MERLFRLQIPQPVRKPYYFYLAICWCLGLLCGTILFQRADPSFFSLMRSACVGPVSIVGLLGVSLIPFLLSAFAVFISAHWLLLLICLLKAGCFAAVSLGIMEAFGTAGWLVRILLLFSDSISVILLYIFWLRHLCGRRRFCCLDMLLFFSLSTLLSSVDYCIISPFWAGLIEI